MKVNFDFMFLRKNSFGASLAIGFLCAYDLWIARGYLKRPLRQDWPRLALAGAMLVIFTGLVMTLSRGAWLGTVAGMIVIGILRGSVKPLLRIGAVLAPVIVVVWFNLPPELKDYTFGFDAEQNRNIELRLLTLQQTQQMFADSPVFGQGLGLRKNIDATNLVWLALAETGVLGALSFGWIFWAFGRMVWRARRILPPSDPRFTLLSLGAALMIYKLTHGMVDHYWTRGALTNAWAGAGMILCFCRIPARSSRPRTARIGTEQTRRARIGDATQSQRAARGGESVIPLKILLLNDTDNWAGTESHILDLATALRAQNAEVSIACPPASPLAKRADEVPVLPLEIGKLVDRRAIRQLAHSLKSNRADILHAHNGRTQLHGALAIALARRGTLVWTQHFIAPHHARLHGPKAALLGRVHRAVNARTHGFIAISQGGQSRYAQTRRGSRCAN